MNETEVRTVYVAYTNSDNTEGRGYDVPIAVCDKEITAMHRAYGKYVQGSNGPVRPVTMIKLDNTWYIEAKAVEIIYPTTAEIKAQKELEEKRVIVNKMKAAGITTDELKKLNIKC